MASHTPGPWTLAQSYRPESGDRGVQSFAPYVLDRDHRNVAAAMIGGFDDMAEVEANARLIAAAPEMLALLATLKDAAESYVNLSRARGGDLRPEAADVVRNEIARARALLAKLDGGA